MGVIRNLRVDNCLGVSWWPCNFVGVSWWPCIFVFNYVCKYESVCLCMCV